MRKSETGVAESMSCNTSCKGLKSRTERIWDWWDVSVAKVLAVKPEDISLIPGTQTVEERIKSLRLSSDLHTCRKLSSIYTNNEKINVFFKLEFKISNHKQVHSLAGCEKTQHFRFYAGHGESYPTCF